MDRNVCRYLISPKWHPDSLHNKLIDVRISVSTCTRNFIFQDDSPQILIQLKFKVIYLIIPKIFPIYSPPYTLIFYFHSISLLMHYHKLISFIIIIILIFQLAFGLPPYFNQHIHIKNTTNLHNFYLRQASFPPLKHSIIFQKNQGT